jgi:hypothetical protein
MIIKKTKDNNKSNHHYIHHINNYCILGTRENICKIKRLYEGSKTLHDLGFKVSIGNVVWNQEKTLLTNEAKDYDYELSNELLELLLDRFVRGIKNVNINNLLKKIEDKEFQDRIKQFETETKKINDEIKEPIELIFLQLGIEVLKNITTFLIKLNSAKSSHS